MSALPKQQEPNPRTNRQALFYGCARIRTIKFNDGKLAIMNSVISLSFTFLTLRDVQIQGNMDG